MEVGEILLRAGLINEAQLEELRQRGGKTLQSAIELGYVHESDALRALGGEVGVDFVDGSLSAVFLKGVEFLPDLGVRQRKFL